MRSFCRKTHVHKFPRFGGGGFWGGGGSADFIFMGARIFLTDIKNVFSVRNRSSKSQSLEIFHRNLKLQCGNAEPCLRNRAISGACDGNHNRKSQQSRQLGALRYRGVGSGGTTSRHFGLISKSSKTRSLTIVAQLCMILRAGKNNKLNFLWPKVARWGPRF